MRISSGRIILAGLALAALSVAGGCIFVDAQFSMAPDGATSARMEAGVLRTAAEHGGGDFTTDLGETLTEGRWVELEPFERGQWQVQAWEGNAAPGESLFVEGDAPRPEFGMEQHLLSTVYTFEMALPDGPVVGTPEAADPPPPAVEPAPEMEGDGEPQMEGMEQFGAAMGEMMAMMMTTGDAGLRFSVELPGEIAATNGELASPSRAAWKIGLTEDEPPHESLIARSRLLNWPVIGKLGGQMAQMGRADLVPALIAGARRGVMPDPASADPMSEELNTLMYVQALEIMIALDEAVGEQIATEVMITLGLGDDPGPATVEEIAVRLEGMDLVGEIEEGVKQRALGLLGGG
ncbi:MAG: hypothetical protein ACOX9R_17200 [Armatimonadota bacterium]